MLVPNLGEAIKKIGQKMKRTENLELPESASSPSQTPPVTSPQKIFLRALPLRSLDDVKTVKNEIESGNIIILRITPLAKKSVEDVKTVVNELCDFVAQIGGDRARLGEERVVITPMSVRIWREKLSMPTEEAATAA
jgi:SepF-like predicted cell division protein (DUF552 family)